MKRAIYTINGFLLVLLLVCKVRAQVMLPAETLEKQLKAHPQPDTLRVNRLNELALRSNIRSAMRDSLLRESVLLSDKLGYPKGKAMALVTQSQFTAMDKAVSIAREALSLAKQSGDTGVLFWAYRQLGEATLNTSDGANALQPFQQAWQLAKASRNAGFMTSAATAFTDYYKLYQLNYPLALQWSLQALQAAEGSGNLQDLGHAYRNVGAVYLLVGDRQKALANLQKALTASRKAGDVQMVQFVLNDVGEQYRLTGKFPEALQAYDEAGKLIKDPFNTELNQSNIADVYQRMGNDSLAFAFSFASLAGARSVKDTIGLAWIDCILGRIHLHRKHIDSALFYGQQGYKYALQTQMLEYQRDNSEILANAYAAKKEYASAFRYYNVFIHTRDSLANTEVTNKSNMQQFDYDLARKQTQIAVLNKDKELQQAQLQRQRYLLFTVLSALLLIVVILFLLYRNNRQRKKAYFLLQDQKAEVQRQRDQTDQVLADLTSTQAQLIQSEKMASLGELTSGIAHEIQNPLNFVTNFSEVSVELIDEMRTELAKGNYDEATAIADDLKQNLEKINHHGKRADAIVKGMLQHSRSSSGQKEKTGINGLCDEYLRLSYHGLRAKDKSFNATIKTDFDESIGTVNVVPQDIGRVILNLLTNAFYAVNERKHQEQGDYEPTVTISTKSLPDKILITVNDNGNGIPQHVSDKIFQPFFTTKPTGQGTGLGLSLSYDIVKAHGGKLTVETSEGEGTSFFVAIPTA